MLPLEICDNIAFYLPYEKGIKLSLFVKKSLCQVPPTEGSWCEFSTKGNLYGLEWMHYHRKTGCTTEAMDKAARNCEMNIVKWLHAKMYNKCNGLGSS
jgi:hypothetical protein